MFALDFWHDIKESEESATASVFVTSTRHQGGGVFMGQIVLPSLSLDADKMMVHFEYEQASYEDIYQDATITLHAALTLPTLPTLPATPAASMADPPDHHGRLIVPPAAKRRLLWGFASRIFKRTWRAAKNVARVAVTAVATVAENLGLTEFSGSKEDMTLYTFDASSSFQTLLPGSQCTATSTLTASISFEMKISSSNLDFAKLEISGKLANLLEIQYELLRIEVSREWKVFSLPPWNLRFMVGYVPVLIDLGAHLFAGFDFIVTGLVTWLAGIG